VITESKNGIDIHYTYGNDLISNGTNFFLTDALGSTRGLVDGSENLTDSYTYSPYGIPSNHIGDSNSSFLFTGEQFDRETEDYYLRARYYSPNSSRFLNRDTYDGTAGSPITQNHYLYGNANPISYVDPSGYMGVLQLQFSMSIAKELKVTRATIFRKLQRDIRNDLGCSLVLKVVDSVVSEGIGTYLLYGNYTLKQDPTQSKKAPYVGITDSFARRFTEHQASGKLKNLTHLFGVIHFDELRGKKNDKLLKTFEEYVMLRLEEYMDGWDNISNGRRNYTRTNERQKIYKKRLKELKKQFCEK